jgi:hypothetical protein
MRLPTVGAENRKLNDPSRISEPRQLEHCLVVIVLPTQSPQCGGTADELYDAPGSLFTEAELDVCAAVTIL